MDIDQAVRNMERELDICSRCKVPMKDGVVLTGFITFGQQGVTELRKCKKCPKCGSSRVKI